MVAPNIRSLTGRLMIALLFILGHSVPAQQNHPGSAHPNRCADLDRNPVPCPPALPAPAGVSIRERASRNPGSAPNLLRRMFRPSRAEGDSRNPGNMASPYVLLDSWVYPALDRLAALGYVQQAFLGLRPWTRLECARLVEQAAEDLEGESDAAGDGADQIFRALQKEFAAESAGHGGRNLEAGVESLYLRMVGISGPPLNDGFHFGQTIVNDYGRPYQQGANLVAGASVYAQAGPLAFYVRGEFQHAPSGPGLPAAARAGIAQADGLPVANSPVAAINRGRWLDAYVALNIHDWQISFGRQSLWWSPGSSSALMLSANAEPICMLRMSRVSPFQLPTWLRVLGAVRSESFIGQLQGHHFVRLAWPEFPLHGALDTTLSPQPFLWGHKISFRPTENLEFGVSITTVLGGYGRPLTLGTFEHSLSMHGNAQALDPGDRRTGFDFTYRVPKLRRWLVLYNDAMAEDEPSPIAYPRRSAMNPGIYLPQLPKLPRLDLRVEAPYTSLPGLIPVGFFYANVHYANGYTNYGQILGSWVGREGHSIRVASSYWLSRGNRIELFYRKQIVDRQFIGGGNLNDIAATADFPLARGLRLSASVQIENWRFPLLSSSRQTNLTALVQFTFRPQWKQP